MNRRFLCVSVTDVEETPLVSYAVLDLENDRGRLPAIGTVYSPAERIIACSSPDSDPDETAIDFSFPIDELNELFKTWGAQAVALTVPGPVQTAITPDPYAHIGKKLEMFTDTQVSYLTHPKVRRDIVGTKGHGSTFMLTGLVTSAFPEIKKHFLNDEIPGVKFSNLQLSIMNAAALACWLLRFPSESIGSAKTDVPATETPLVNP